MRLNRSVVAVALAFALVAHADDKKEERKPAANAARTPFNVFENAAEGDWTACLAKNVRNGKEEGSPTLLIWTVKKIDGDMITIAAEERRDGKARPAKEGTFDKKEAPTIFALINPHDQDTPGSPDAKTTDEKLKVGDHEFTCKKVTFSISNGEKGPSLNLETWFSTEVKGTGIVKLTITASKSPEKVATAELVGFGTKDKTAWGKSPDEVQKIAK